MTMLNIFLKLSMRSKDIYMHWWKSLKDPNLRNENPKDRRILGLALIILLENLKKDHDDLGTVMYSWSKWIGHG